MATEFVAAVIALALFIIVSSVGKPLEKILDVSRCLPMSRRKNSCQVMFAEEELQS